MPFAIGPDPEKIAAWKRRAVNIAIASAAGLAIGLWAAALIWWV